MRILIIEDEKKLAEAIKHILVKNKYIVDMVHDGISGLDYGLTGIYDIIILDIMLPEMNGLDVLKELRKNKIFTPIILLTAKDEIQDKVRGLDYGADDYLTKPFSIDELLARIRALSRRRGDIIVDDIIEIEDIKLNLSTYELICGNKSVKLSLKECHIIEFLIKRKGQVVSKEEILEKIWGFDSDAEYNNVEVYISFLRKKLAYLHSRINIKTLRGIGYSIEGSI
ncbi:response regulator transcription factor [Defluviitalea phaphyphila]|uniref:response regulator transcription factor n=1 Tax=Defluviitalea phaphyphila TaxID=1473580 RepID=UPI0007300AAF|nr:response regulator transcription factor [Defluviitalea phaphyphila]